jgi:two-component system, cell cycle sensor histidine kinase and response regulator CckA
MPSMNGLEMLTALRQITPGIPVIMASGYSKEQVINIAHPEPFHAFLVKPYGLQELKEAIRLSLADKKKG